MQSQTRVMPHKLPGLNGLRAIAASVVLIYHVCQISGLFGISEGRMLVQKFSVGGDMVNLFFVLSGFIITYVLLKEKEKFGTINLPIFYIKRTLRIWPIYFLIFIAVGIVCRFSNLFNIVPSLNGNSVFLVAFFLVNFNYLFHFPLSVIGHYWSLSVEEQFYLFWPIFFKRFNPAKTAIAIIIICFLIRNGADYIAFHGGDQIFWQAVWRVMIESKFGSIAIGVLGALAFYKEYFFLRFIFLPFSQMVILFLFFGSLIFTHTRVPYIESEVMAILYIILILNVAFNPNKLISFDNKVFNHLGKISYGLYMYHWPLIVLIIVGIKRTSWWSFFISFHLLPLILTCYIITYIISLLSFTYFEASFLKLKPKPHRLNKNVHSNYKSALPQPKPSTSQ